MTSVTVTPVATSLSASTQMRMFRSRYPIIVICPTPGIVSSMSSTW